MNIYDRNQTKNNRFSFTQNSKWKIKWNNNIGGIHRSDNERKRRIQ
jgi:hypothetical protein